jgi:mRNA interferase RelE/StbE
VAAYTVDARPGVRKALRQLDPKVRRDVLAKMRALATEPRPAGSEPLQGHPPWLRIRTGDYRIIYAIDDQARVVTVGTVGHRREVYQRLSLLYG